MKLWLKTVAAVFVFAVLSVSAYAQSGVYGDNIYWSYDENAAVLTIGGTGALDITPTKACNSIYELQSLLEWNKLTPKKIVIGEGITKIEQYTLPLAQVESVELPASLEEIGTGAFYNSSVREVTFAGAPKIIGRSAFNSCQKLEQIIIPDGVQEIGNYAFSNCRKLSRIELPDSIRRIGRHAFLYTAHRNDRENNWVNGVYYIGHNLIEASTDLEGEYIVWPGTVCIAESAFGSYVYGGCTSPYSGGCDKLEHLIIPDSVESIGEGAFSGCKNLWGIEVSRYNKNYISDDGFVYTSDYSTLVSYAPGDDREEYVVPDGVRIIEGGAFLQAEHLKKIVLPDSVEHIGAEAFRDCTSLEEINCPAGLKTIGTAYLSIFNRCDKLNFKYKDAILQKAAEVYTY